MTNLFRFQRERKKEGKDPPDKWPSLRRDTGGCKLPTRLGEVERQGQPRRLGAKGGPGEPRTGARGWGWSAVPFAHFPHSGTEVPSLWTQEGPKRVPQIGRLAGMGRGRHTAGNSACYWFVPCPVEPGLGLAELQHTPANLPCSGTPFWDGVKTGTLESPHPGPGAVSRGRRA